MVEAAGAAELVRSVESVPPDRSDRPTADDPRPDGDAPALTRDRAGTHLLLLASVVIWGSTFVAMKVLLRHVTPFELVGLRFAIGLPVLAAVLAWRRIPVAFERRDLGPLALGSAILVVHFLVQPLALSLERTTATNTGWIVTVSPLAIALLAHWILGEPLAPPASSCSSPSS